jgi:adenosylmethionine-8-amino-7-oxononanoate aminotransferase
LHKILKRGLDYELQVMQDLMNNESAAPLSIHTSGGVSAALGDFIAALEPHLPWNNNTENDWCVSLQLEGASAVWAAVDMLLQVNTLLDATSKSRNKVAVAGTSYHGPPSTCFGAKAPIWTKEHQVIYPTPKVNTPMDEAQLLQDYEAFLDQHAHEVGVMLVEPQWGSSQAGFPWPKDLLKQYIVMAQSRGIKVVCDEIMCGLGRHGHGTLFVSEAWDLNPDAITFGKAMGAGVFPISGAVLKQGRELLGENKCSVMQSHTYAGSSVRALMAATDVLNELPTWFASITKLGKEMEHIFRYLNKISEGLVSCNGQGLMWGGVFSREGQCADDAFRQNVICTFKEQCNAHGLVPYFVPVGGFMMSPVFDIDVGTIYEIGQRFEQVLTSVMTQVGWQGPPQLKSISSEFSMCSEESEPQLLMSADVSKEDQCNPVLHATKSCTACAQFVCPEVRTRFMSM